MDGFCDLVMQFSPQGPVGLMESSLRRSVTYCDMFGKSSILAETLEVRGVGKAQKGSYLPKVTQPDRQSKAKACDLFASDRDHRPSAYCGWTRCLTYLGSHNSLARKVPSALFTSGKTEDRRREGIPRSHGWEDT